MLVGYLTANVQLLLQLISFSFARLILELALGVSDMFIFRFYFLRNNLARMPFERD
jgi:hypothetical protein